MHRNHACFEACNLEEFKLLVIGSASELKGSDRYSETHLLRWFKTEGFTSFFTRSTFNWVLGAEEAEQKYVEQRRYNGCCAAGQPFVQPLFGLVGWCWKNVNLAGREPKGDWFDIRCYLTKVGYLGTRLSAIIERWKWSLCYHNLPTICARQSDEGIKKKYISL